MDVCSVVFFTAIKAVSAALEKYCFIEVEMEHYL